MITCANFLYVNVDYNCEDCRLGTTFGPYFNWLNIHMFLRSFFSEENFSIYDSLRR